LIDDNLVEELSVFPSLSDFLTLVLDFLDVVVQETPEMCTATPVTPVTVKKSEHSIDDTPVNTVVKKSECSTDDTPVNTVEESPPTTSRKSRTSVRKSLKLGKVAVHISGVSCTITSLFPTAFGVSMSILLKDVLLARFFVVATGVLKWQPLLPQQDHTEHEEHLELLPLLQNQNVQRVQIRQLNKRQNPTCPFGQLTKKSTCPTQSFSCPKKLIKITKTRG
jgi:hypothetical protein